MNKLIILGTLGLLLVSCVSLVSSYICVYPTTDNEAVQSFKTKINQLALQQDLDRGTSEEAILLKIKYFNPCNK